MFYMDGALDLHVHSGPDVLTRIADDLQFARWAKSYGMAGIAVKSHFESTSSRAHYVNQALDDFRMIGGICLNYGVGGINPAAVDSCLRTGGRIVWMPSSHSRFHAAITGQPGDWGRSTMRLYCPPNAPGITILDENGALTDDTREVVSLVKEHDALLATSHLSPQEILAIVRYCRDEGVKVMLNHIRWVSAYDLELAKAAVELGAYIEITAATISGFTKKMEISDALEIISVIGPGRIVLASDCGGAHSVASHEAMRGLSCNLKNLGISTDALRHMMVDNPWMLVNEGHT